MKNYLILCLFCTGSIFESFAQSNIQSINHLPVEEGGTPPCINTLNSVQFKECVVYKAGMKTSDLVIRLWNAKRCTQYEPISYSPESLKLSFGAKENFKTVRITVKSRSGKTFEGKVLIHKQSKAPCNVAPVAVNDQFIAGLDKPLTDKVGSNDKDDDQDFLVFSLTAKPQHAAQFTLNEDGSFTYNPAKGYKGTDMFKYKVSDGLESAEASVYLKVLEYGIDISLAASIELGCPRTPLELRVVAPSEIPLLVKLTVTPGFPELTLWNAATGGKRINTTSWKAGEQPSTLWIDASGANEVIATGQLLAEGSVKAEDKKTAKTHSVWPRRWCVPNGNPEGSHGITRKSVEITYDLDWNPVQGDCIAHLMDALRQAGLEQLKMDPDEQGAFSEDAAIGALNLGHSIEGKKIAEIAVNQCTDKTNHTVWRVELTPVSKTLEIIWENTISLPVWKQLHQKEVKLTPKAQDEWSKFTKAVRIHEEGHKRLFDKYYEKSLKLIDIFVKTKFIGESLSLGYDANFNGEAKEKAGAMAIASFDSALSALNNELKTLREAYDLEQSNYDILTEHGIAQFKDPETKKNYQDKISTVVDGNIPLLPPPPRQMPKEQVKPTQQKSKKPESQKTEQQKQQPKAPVNVNPPKKKK